MVIENLELVNHDGADRHLDGLAGAGEFVSALAVDFDGGKIRDALLDWPDKTIDDGFEIGESGWSEVLIGNDRGDFSLGVASARGCAEADGSKVFFVELEKILGVLGGVVGEKNEQAGSKRVERAGVADFDFAAFFAGGAVGILEEKRRERAR